MSGGTHRIKLLIVDDSSVDREALKSLLEINSTMWKVDWSAGGDEALALLRQSDYDVVISDLYNENMPGEDFMDLVAHEAPSVARMILSHKPEAARDCHIADNDHFYLRKGCSRATFVAAVEEAAELHRDLVVHPRQLSNQDLTEILVDFFSREVLMQKMTLEDIPAKLRPYISRELLRDSDVQLDGDMPLPEETSWIV